LIGGLARDYGSHSFRKGNVTSLTSNPDGPPIASIFLRAQWQSKFGKAQQQYIYTGVGGDQQSGRLAAGLSPMDDTFALLPPHWNPSLPCISTLELREIIAGFSSLDTSFQAVIPYLLASVIFHADWIKINYPSQHPIFNTRFWTNNYFIKYRQCIITGDFSNETSRMKATGVSGVMRKMYLLEKKIDSIQNNLLSNSPSVNNSACLSNVLPILTSIQTQLTTGFSDTKEALSNLRATHENEITEINEDSYRLFMYNGGFHKIPEGYKFTATTIKEFWNLYFLGVPAINFRPFRMLGKKDFILLNLKHEYKNIFSNGCCVMRELADLIQKGGFIQCVRELYNASPEESNRLFVESYKLFVEKYCGGNDTQPAIATAYRKIRETFKKGV